MSNNTENGVSKLTAFLRAIPDFFFIGFGLWTVFCNLFVFSGRTFNELARWSVVPVALFFLAVLYRRKVLARHSSDAVVGPPESQPESGRRFSWVIALCCAAAIVGIYFVTGNFVLWWLTSIAFVLFTLFKTTSDCRQHHSIMPRDETTTPTWFLLVLLILVTVLVFSVFVPNQNWESSFYLSMGVSSSEFPDRALLRNDWLHGEQNLPPLGFYYLAHSYELLIATLSRFTGIKQFTLFWEILPRVAIVMSIIVHWLALRQFGINRRCAIFGVLLAVLVWMSWGGPPRALGRWSFAAMTSGKGILVTLGVPAVVYYAARYRERGDLFSWATFACALISAAGFSSSGILVAPLTAAYVLFSRLEKTRDAVVRTAWGFVPTLHIALVAVAIVMVMASETDANALQQISDRVLVSSHTAERGFRLVLGMGGDGPRPYLALFCLLAIPAIPMHRQVDQQRLRALVLAILLLALNPFTAVALSKLAPNMWWRSFWSVPFPLLIGLAGAKLASTMFRVGRVPVNLLAFWSLALAFVLAPQPWAISESNVRLPSWKGSRPYYVDRHYRAAEAVGQYFGPSDFLLAPTRVTMWLIAFEKRPRLVAVREPYVTPIFVSLGRRETSARRALQALMDGKAKELGITDAGQASRFLVGEISRLGISGVVLDSKRGLHKVFAMILRDKGFVELQAVDGYTFWKSCANCSKQS